ncbi:hypothetical protein [Blastopirellula marina]|uniref:Uncharacterized protein n=1 Tax=Blastopirellula marina TaxID=124 RepID=A0A2S8G0M7_9BACT|nr:hypothetical protein [Blastopirellula marina]PQO37999.1 hypothetical protein C5Y98_07880 [Blastopirellula marina]PTL44655.1 hypothetical protein C5Y97_07880 [Blastopirellula marina]
MDPIVKLLEQVQADQLLVPSMFEIDIDEALDNRDADPFDADWGEAHAQIADSVIDARDRPGLVELREAVYLRCYQLTQNADLCGYVADDFGLIGTYLLLDEQNDWVNALWLQYRDGHFPCGNLQPHEGSLKSLIE